jgi:hypothetical protein
MTHGAQNRSFAKSRLNSLSLRYGSASPSIFARPESIFSRNRNAPKKRAIHITPCRHSSPLHKKKSGDAAGPRTMNGRKAKKEKHITPSPLPQSSVFGGRSDSMRSLNSVSFIPIVEPVMAEGGLLGLHCSPDRVVLPKKPMTTSACGAQQLWNIDIRQIQSTGLRMLRSPLVILSIPRMLSTLVC